MSIADVDQKKFADILNKVNVAEMHDGDPKKVEEVLHEMIDYARDHFEVEETHMLESAYPDYKQHKEEHLGYVLKTLSCLKREVSSDCQILNEIREYLKQWLLNHIQGTDKKYTEYLENSYYKN